MLCNLIALIGMKLLLVHAGGDNEVQRTMLEIVNQLDGFDSRGNIKVILLTLCALLYSKGGFAGLLSDFMSSPSSHNYWSQKVKLFVQA